MHQQLWGYKVEEKLYVGVREQKRLNTAGLKHNDCYMNHMLSRQKLFMFFPHSVFMCFMWQ
jgi:hypothetical protein